jgi:hypothetical protein
MARTKYVTIKLEGEEKISAALRSHEERGSAQLRELVDDLADVAGIALIAHVPRGSSDYILEHVDRDGPLWMPGGAGGSGEWKAIVGIKKGHSRHPIYVEEGTGIYAGRSEWGGRPMPMTKAFPESDPGGPASKTKFRQYVKGQRPQKYFYMTWRTLNAVVAARIAARKIL